MSAVGAAGRAEADGPNGSGIHAVVVLFMCLHVRTEFASDVSVHINIPTSHDLAWRVILGDAIGGRKCIEPEVCVVDHPPEHQFADVGEWEDVVLAACAVLEGADVPFDLWDVIVDSANIDLDVREFVVDASELHISEDRADFEMSCCVEGHGIFDGCNECRCLSILQLFDCSKLKVP